MDEQNVGEVVVTDDGQVVTAEEAKTLNPHTDSDPVPATAPAASESSVAINVAATAKAEPTGMAPVKPPSENVKGTPAQKVSDNSSAMPGAALATPPLADSLEKFTAAPTPTAGPVKPPKRKTCRGMVIVACIVVICAACTVWLSYRLFFPTTVSRADINRATADSRLLASDITSANSAVVNIIAATDTATVSADTSGVHSELAAATVPYEQLAGSDVTVRGAARQAFVAVAQKWNRYIGLTQEITADMGALTPVDSSLTTQLNSIDKNPANAASAAADAQKYQEAITAATALANGLHMAEPSDMQMLQAFKTYVAAAAEAVTSKQNAGSSPAQFTTAATAVSAAQRTYLSTLTATQSQDAAELSAASPLSQVQHMTKVISGLTN